MGPIVGRGRLEVVRHRNHLGLDVRGLQRAAVRGELLRLRSGAYVAARLWARLTAEQRMRLEIAAAHEVGRGTVIATHASAAALWEVPRIRRPDGLVHVRGSVATGTRTENGCRKHAVADLDLHVVEVLGIPCTSLERTIVDLALSEPLADAVVAADWALREHVTMEALQRTLDELDPAKGRRRAQAVLDFADPRAASPGESWSRVQIAEAGLPAPLLQVRFDDRAGFIGEVDFFWPDARLIGEFDGLVKYSDPAMLAGRSPSEVVVVEKRREDRLRGTGPGVTRWLWTTLRTRGALAAQLRAAGLR